MLRRLGRPLLPHLARWHSARSHVHTVGATTIFIAPGVFDPVMTKVGAWLAETMAEAVRPGDRWLELGAGSGIVAVAMARRGARVIAVDIDPLACRNTRMNAVLNAVALDVREGDLFAPVVGERIDGVVANLPFWPEETGSLPLGRSFSAGPDFALLRRFVAEAPAYAPRALLALSEAFQQFPEARSALGPGARLVRRARCRGEWLNLFDAAGGGPDA